MYHNKHITTRKINKGGNAHSPAPSRDRNSGGTTLIDVQTSNSLPLTPAYAVLMLWSSTQQNTTQTKLAYPYKLKLHTELQGRFQSIYTRTSQPHRQFSTAMPRPLSGVLSLCTNPLHSHFCYVCDCSAWLQFLSRCYWKIENFNKTLTFTC